MVTNSGIDALRTHSGDDVPGGIKLTAELTFKRERSENPLCAAESLTCAHKTEARTDT